jgi:hypothetical protein
MSVYDPLRDYLLRQTYREIELRFDEIEKILRRRLPTSAERSQWWANSKEKSHTQREAWREAGYDAFLINGQAAFDFERSDSRNDARGSCVALVHDHHCYRVGGFARFQPADQSQTE